MSPRAAVMFPGQGAYLPGVLAERARHFPRAVDVLDTIDAVAAEHGLEPVTPLVLERDATPLEDLLAKNSDQLDLAIYAVNATAFEILSGLGLQADVLVGHSFGEFAALSASGAVSVADVAHMACTRTAAFHRADPAEGGLLALDIPAWRAKHLVGLLDDPGLHLAIDNGPGQTVVSGHLAALEAAEEVAVKLGFRATRLRARYAFHNPLLHGAADIFRGATADVPLAKPRTPVFSPVLSRYVRTVDDVREVIGQNMVAPVHFYDALLLLFRTGTSVFVEAGARQALTGIVRSSLPSAALATPLLPSRGDIDGIITSLTEAGFQVSWRRTATGPVPDVTSDSEAVPEARPTASGQETLPGRDGVLVELAELYAQDLGFPVEMLTPDIDLEADLGVDSAKQLALFQRVRTQYGLAEPPAERRVRATTLDKIAELVEEQRR
ncbi:Malonyl CoA-acyl carrier protein transacylase [Streptomyces hundungensis]|uniref:[acyl-carrier-protein] S-malonyltransferase n=1 Tax=Streptomyces hundungensis TaxID=1077946 RepID=A0A387HB48_9ACTN|nr:acyltransferase domain-containing protein [Streptomyces hundungensis]AYG77997.1 Malonyl CoA-acyl carrier protein transacylase [Streptomyces hundungensis]